MALFYPKKKKKKEKNVNGFRILDLDVSGSSGSHLNPHAKLNVGPCTKVGPPKLGRCR